MTLVLGKARSHRVPNLGCRGAESPGWFDVLPKNSTWDVMREQACCRDKAANHQLSIAAVFWIIQIVSTGECSNLVQNLIQIRCSTHSVILNVTATQYTCLLSGTYRPHWLVQWSHHCSHMSPLPLAARLHPCHANCSCSINNSWTFSGQTSYTKFYLPFNLLMIK